jgi:hypothetical protein
MDSQTGRNNMSPKERGKGRVMVINATFNNISVISWQSVLLLEETRVPREQTTKYELNYPGYRQQGTS